MRRLCFAAAGFTAALLLSHYFLPYAWLLYAAAASALLASAAFLFRGKRRAALALTLLSAAAGFAWTWGYTALFVLPAEMHAGETRPVAVRIATYPEAAENYTSVEAVCIDGELPRGRMLIYDNDAGMQELRPGDLAVMELRLVSAATRYHEPSDRYLSDGLHYRAYLAGGYEVTGRARLAFLCFPQVIAHAVKRAALSAFPPDVAPLMKALLTGDKAEYYADDTLYSAMRIAGLQHIVAVSGMHVAFLVGLLSLLTGRRRITAFLGIPLILVFMAMIGFTPSVIRAGVMQILLLIAPLLRRENDPPTSLAAALLILLLVNPISVGSVSLQLSFTAMAGLILVAPRIFRAILLDEHGRSRVKRGLWSGLLRWIVSIFASSVGAIVFTAPISAFYFGFVPLYGILTNLLCLWAMTGAFLLGYAVCVLWLIWAPLGAAAGWLVGWLPRYTIAVVCFIARLPYAELVTRRNLAAWWLGFLYVLFISTYLLRGGERYRPTIPICAALVTFGVLTLVQQRDLDGRIELTAVDVGQGLSFVAMTEDATVVIDCGSTGSADNAGDRTADYLAACGRDTIDLLILTHFHADHANGVIRLMSRTDVERVAVSTECEQNYYYDRILAFCEEQGTDVIMVSQNTGISVGALDLTLYAPLGSEDANEYCLLISGSYGDFDFLVTGDAGQGVEKLLTSIYDLGDMELLVVGHHGSSTSTCEELLDEIRPEYAFVSVGAGNSYGHPADSVLERLADYDVEVFRTDRDGTVTVTAGEDDG
jgi:competence protein ComEC